jgi:hypothetical protein
VPLPAPQGYSCYQPVNNHDPQTLNSGAQAPVDCATPVAVVSANGTAAVEQDKLEPGWDHPPTVPPGQVPGFAAYPC